MKTVYSSIQLQAAHLHHPPSDNYLLNPFLFITSNSLFAMVEDLVYNGVVGVFDIRDDAIYFEPKTDLDISLEPFAFAKEKLKEEGYPITWDSRGCITVHDTDNIDYVKLVIAEAYSKILEEMK